MSRTSLPPMTEAQFQDRVIELGRLFKWRIHHTRPARTEKGWRTPIQGDVGFPDLVLARTGRIIFAELKSDKGRTTEEQEKWLAALGHKTFNPTGQVVDPQRNPEVYLWRPADIAEIEEILR